MKMSLFNQTHIFPNLWRSFKHKREKARNVHLSKFNPMQYKAHYMTACVIEQMCQVYNNMRMCTFWVLTFSAIVSFVTTEADV